MTTYYTDGGYSIPKHTGGWACVVVNNGKYVTHFAEELKHSTSNRAEMMALICALNLAAKEKKPTTIFTDSMYLVKGYRHWMFQWKDKGWKNTKGKDVKNADLWRKIFSLWQNYIKVKFVKGHSTSEFNNLADSLAKF